MPKYWIAVASQEHVLKGIRGGFAQVCHGKPGPLCRMQEGDWIAYYSPTKIFGKKEPCQAFTAIGRVPSGNPYPFAMSEDFVPWRRNVSFIAAQTAAIQPLLSTLSFIKDKQKWGFPFRKGCFEVPQNDFAIIAAAMGVAL